MDTSSAVLVVEDSNTIVTIVANHLRKLGFTDIDVAPDGESALKRMSLKQYGLILSDWEMQPMGGEEFLKELRRTGNKIPVVLITGKTTRGASWLAGASAYLTKPFSERDFRTALKMALDKV